MPPKSTSSRKVLGEANNKANQSLTPRPSSCAGKSASQEPEHIDLTSDPAPGFTMISGGSASIGETVDGRPLSSLGAGLGGLNRKRKSDGPAEETGDLDDFDVEGMPIDKNPDQVRRQIRRFIDNGGMKVGEFCNALGVSNNAYNRFMQQSGRTKGADSGVFQEGWAFFAKREMAGLIMPTKKQKISSSAGGSSSSGAKASEKSVDISDIHLDGEDDDSAAVYDTCDEIRRKINAHLKQGGTKAQFCRDLRAQLHSSDAPQDIKGSQLNRFRSNKGPTAGCTSSVYYAAYVFFEKHRLAEKKSKSKHRQEMEGVWPAGIRRDFDGSKRGFLCSGSERPHEDKFGRVSFY